MLGQEDAQQRRDIAPHQRGLDLTEVPELRLDCCDIEGFTLRHFASASTFCHNEGTPVTADNRGRGPGEYTGHGRSGRDSLYLAINGATFAAATITPGGAFTDMLGIMRAALGIEEVHFTGGEPSLHPHLPELVASATVLGLHVGIDHDEHLLVLADLGYEKPRYYSDLLGLGLW